MNKTQQLGLGAIVDDLIRAAVEASPTGDVHSDTIARDFAAQLPLDAQEHMAWLGCRAYVDQRVRYRLKAIKSENADVQLVPAADGSNPRWFRSAAKMTALQWRQRAEMKYEMAGQISASADKDVRVAELMEELGVETTDEIPDWERVLSEIINPEGAGE